MTSHSRHERGSGSTPSPPGAEQDASATLSTSHADKTQDPHIFQPPSEEEASRFYYGLPSEPRLLGRTSSATEIWEGYDIQRSNWWRDRGGQERFSLRSKALGSIGNHDIRRCWADQVQPNIMAAIEHLSWSSIDIFRIGYKDTPLPERPVVVWIGVDQKDLPWDDVNNVLRACRRVLDGANLADVDCQIRVSNIVSLVSTTAGPPLLNPRLERSVLARPFTTSIGQSIFPFSSPGLMGSLGVYLRPATSDDNDNDDTNDIGSQERKPLWAITCHHVGLPDHPNLHYRRQDASSSSEYPIGIPGEHDTQFSIDALLLQEDELSHQKDGESAAETEQRLDQLEKTKALRNAIKAFEPLEARKTGVVVLAPPIGPALHPFPWTRDWCLVELYDQKYPEGNAMTNIVDIEVPQQLRLTLHRLLNRTQKPGQPVLYLPYNGLLRIEGLISLSEIRNPPGPTINVEGEECIVVAKCGATTGLTWGSPSELQSTVRSCLPGGATFVSQEWAIHGSLQDRTVSFSAPGDSGAAVFGFDGRLGGFMTRGTGLDEGRTVDITYATPAELVLGDIEEKLGAKVVVI